MYLFLSLKAQQSSILWSVLCRFHSLYHCCHSLSLIAICCHSLSLVVLLTVIFYHLLYHSLFFVVTRCITRCHSLSLVVTRCHLLSLVVALVVIRCHSLSLDVPLVCIFMKDPLTSFYYVSQEIWLGNVKKVDLHRPIKVLHFLTPARIQKCLT